MTNFLQNQTIMTNRLQSRRAKASTQSFRFLDLPGELRNMVYDFAFEDIESKVTLDLTRNEPSKLRKALSKKKRRSTHLSLLLTSRQIRHETFARVYSTIYATIDLHSINPTSIGALKGGKRLQNALDKVGNDLTRIEKLNFPDIFALWCFLVCLTWIKTPLHELPPTATWGEVQERMIAGRTFTLLCARLSKVRMLNVGTVWSGDQTIVGAELLMVQSLLMGQERRGFKQAFPALKEVRIELPELPGGMAPVFRYNVDHRGHWKGMR